jgi:type IV pilus assembly protein PilN
MRISINLATRPFVELRPLFARLRLAMAGLAVTAVALGIGLHFLNRNARAAQTQMDTLKAQTEAFDNERLTNEARMREPQNRAVLDRSKFLNGLFASKSFSWTSVMMDLEAVLPGGVQVTSIDPQFTPDGDVNIRLRVSGQRDLAVDLVRNLERSRRFLNPRLANETAQTQEQGRLVPAAQTGMPGGVEFEIMSGYNPLPEQAKRPDEKPEKDEKGGGGPAQADHKAGGPAAGSGPGAGHKAAAPASPAAAQPKKATTKGGVR